MLMEAQLMVRAEACRICATECESHAAMHEHCRVCDAGAGEAYVRAVEAGSNAADEVGHVSVAQESASASGTPGTRPFGRPTALRP
jgi:sorbitol-specific phosphotransferase system component IIA